MFPSRTRARPGRRSRSLNLTIRPGERIALVGENGAGKTTLVKLLMGLYRPTSGRILVDGMDLRELAPADWHRRFGTVFQHYLRLQATVRENVAPGAIAGSSGDLALAAAVARSGADEVAARLPGGLETPLGREFHEGSELSVGQWQKLAIARAYLRDGEILVLDEPASALDAKGGGGGVPPFRADGRGADRDPDLAPAGLLPACRPHPGAARRAADRAGEPRGARLFRRHLCRALPHAGRLVPVVLTEPLRAQLPMPCATERHEHSPSSVTMERVRPSQTPTASRSDSPVARDVVRCTAARTASWSASTVTLRRARVTAV